ncbi:hypothetical protein N0V93_001336 [Gnomoniopsis smithogilvyi]|uniref:Uncharacterized protein n=1 Tax=Gnomoniopsis smithogilvyi TaxID=1191159 RepID=A0A9W9D140_9PEZI|nr:hypothetical protein N0V93_001336 [Gnomoniopsis smithogilvyi]
MFSKLWLLMTVASCLVMATGNVVTPRDFASIKSALDSVNALLLQINDQINGLDAQNIATNAPALLQFGQTIIQPTLQGFRQQVEASAPLSLDETNGLNTARTAFNQNVNLTVSTLVNQKPLFDMVGLSSQVAGIVQQVHDEASSLFGIIQSKLAPSDTNTAIAQLFSESLGVFEMAIAVFRGQAAVLPAPAAVSPMTGQGTINSDGSCNCEVTCPAGSFM